MYFLHINCVPELFSANCKLRRGCWFNLPPDELLEFMPKVFNWVKVRRFWRCFHQLIPCLPKMLVAALEVCLGSLSCMNLCESG